MHTIMVVAGGFVLLGLCLLAARLLGNRTPAAMARGAKLFLPLWLLCALVNMWVGVTRAGYSFAAELPILLVVFIVPAAVASYIWLRLSRS